MNNHFKKIHKISVILSVYNGGDYLKLAIESILNQTHDMFDFIIVDNASTDKTPLVLENYRLKDKRIKIITLPQTLSYVEGRKYGIDRCETDWFALMDADDISKKDRIKRQIDYLNKSTNKNLGAIGTWGEYINAKGKVLGTMKAGPTTIKEFDYLYSNNEAILLIDPSSLINKKAFLETGGYRVETFPPCDLDFWYRLSEKGYKIIAIPEILFQYRVHLQSNSVEKSMFQRKYTHFVNYNMRLRRLSIKELTKDEFEKIVWSNFFYKIPKLYKDFTMTLYKKAGLYYGENKVLLFMYYSFFSFVLNPRYFIKKFIKQNLIKILFTELAGLDKILKKNKNFFKLK